MEKRDILLINLDTDHSNKKNNKEKNAKAPLIFTFIVIIVAFIYLYLNRENYLDLFDLSFLTILKLFALNIFLPVINGMINFYFFRSLEVNLRWNESIGLASVNTFANLLPISGGIIAKGVYLKKKFQFPYSKFVSSIMALYIFFISVNGIIGVIILTSWWVSGGTNITNWLIIGYLFMVMILFLLWLPVEKIFEHTKYRNIVINFSKGWKILISTPKLLSKLIVFQILAIIIFSAKYYVTFNSFSQKISFIQCILFSSSTILTRIVSFAPGGLGVREGIVAGIASLMGFKFNVSIAALTFDRLIETFVIIILGTIYTYRLSSNLSKDS